MKNKKKYELEIMVALGSIVVGVLLLFFPFLKINNCKIVFIISFGIMALIRALLFIVKPKDTDNESISTFIANLILMILMILLKITPLNLALMLLLYVLMLSLIRLKKADFYHDRKNGIWQINIITLGLFILSGVLTSINLSYQSEVQMIVLGFFFLINGILELIDPLVLFLKG